MTANARTLIGPRGVVARNVILATSRRDRRRGVLGRDPLEPDEALVIRPCRQVHTFGVPYVLDAVFCDRRLRVLHVDTLAPESMSRRAWRARCCVELLGNRAAECGIVPGSQLRIEETT